MKYCVVDPTGKVLREVREERARQDEKWGEQNLPDGTGDERDVMMRDIAKGIADASAAAGTLTWCQILTEEVFEAYAETDPKRLREELLQVAAVAAAWVEHIDRRTAAIDACPATERAPSDYPNALGSKVAS